MGRTSARQPDLVDVVECSLAMLEITLPLSLVSILVGCTERGQRGGGVCVHVCGVGKRYTNAYITHTHTHTHTHTQTCMHIN